MITDRAHFLAEPDGLIDAILAHARTLGVPTAGGASDRGQVFTMFNNNCKTCFARVCSAGDKKANCICFNSSKPVPRPRRRMASAPSYSSAAST